MYGFIVFVHIIVCVGLVLVVLFQTGKGAGLGNVFGGGGGADQLFSAPSGSSFLKKTTTTMAIIFVLTSLSLTILTSHRNQASLLEQIPMPNTPSAPRSAPGP
jgi:preprotein translocase subunit SecG